MAGLSVIVADDHPIVRAGLRTALGHALGGAPEIREVASMTALHRELDRMPADLLLHDLYFPGLEPEDGIRTLRRHHPLMAILLVSMLSDRGVVERLLRAGANGFVGKSAPPECLETGLREVMEGKRPLYLPTPGRGRHVQVSDNPIPDLPPRQAEILRLICLGLSNKEIAQTLDLSLSTVRGHVSALLQKLNVPNRTSAASYGVAHGALSLSHNTENGRS